MLTVSNKKQDCAKQGIAKQVLKDNERLDDLNLDGLKIIQDKNGYGFTSDSVLLANFVKTKKGDVCAEIGLGSGIISILVMYKERPKKIYGFEMQEGVSYLAGRNVELNNMQDRIFVINDKAQNYKKYFSDGDFDVVFSNPPYFKYDKNVCGECKEKVCSRFDLHLPLNEFFESISRMLKFGGKLFFVNDSARLCECFAYMKQFNLSPKRMYFVHPNNSKNSTVFLCEAHKGGRDGLIVMPPLFTNDLNGDYIETIQKLYKK